MKELTRDYKIDLIKFFAIIATIAIHVLAPGSVYDMGTMTWKYFLLAGSFFRFCVPAFCMASGYLLYTRGEISYEKVARQVVKFFIYFILAEIFYRSLSCLSTIFHHHKPLELGAMVSDILDGNFKNHLYYIFIIIFIYIFAPLGNFLVKKEEGQLKYILGIWIIISLTINFAITVFNIRTFKILKFYELSGAYNYVMFALLGGYFKKYKSKILDRKVGFYVFIFLASYILLVLSVIKMSGEALNLYAWEGNNILIFGLAYSLFALCMKAKIESQKLKTFLRIVSENIFVIFIIHLVFLDFLGSRGLTYVNFAGLSKVLVSILEVMGIFIISLITSIIIRSIKKILNLKIL